MIDYSETIIYKIICKDKNIKDVYVGSTTNFRVRKNNHKERCTKRVEIKLYDFISKNGGWGNFEMIPIEEYKDCKNKLESRIREREWYEKLNSTLNSCYPQRLKSECNKEYYEKNKDKYKVNSKKWRAKNKEKISQDKKQYYKENKDRLKVYHKKWRTENKEHKKIKDKEYYEKNKHKIHEKITCECGSIISKSYLSRHRKTKIHSENLIKNKK
jgi:hypothetical protein